MLRALASAGRERARQFLAQTKARRAHTGTSRGGREEIIDVEDPRHPSHPANWDPTYPKIGPPEPVAWSEDPRNRGKFHPVLHGWGGMLLAGIFWASATTFFANSSRRDLTEEDGGSSSPTPRLPAGRQASVVMVPNWVRGARPHCFLPAAEGRLQWGRWIGPAAGSAPSLPGCGAGAQRYEPIGPCRRRCCRC